MAWSIVGVGTVVETATTTLTLTEPAGVASGDLLVACIAGRGYTAGTGWCGVASGWTSVNSVGNANTATNTSALANGRMAFIVRGGSAPSYAFTLTGTASVAMGRVVAYRATAGSTISLTANTAATTPTNSTALNIATAVTTTSPNELIVAMAAGGQEATWTSFVASNPSGASGVTNTTSAPSTTTWFERADTNTVTGADTSLGIFDAVQATARDAGGYAGTASLGAGHVVISGAFRETPLLLTADNAISPYLNSTTIITVGSGDTVTGIPFGTAASDRVVSLFVVFTSSVTTATLGGISATVTTLTGNQRLITAAIPTGTSGTLVATSGHAGPISVYTSYSLYPTAGKTLSTTPFPVAGTSTALSIPYAFAAGTQCIAGSASVTGDRRLTGLTNSTPAFFTDIVDYDLFNSNVWGSLKLVSDVGASVLNVTCSNVSAAYLFYAFTEITNVTVNVTTNVVAATVGGEWVRAINSALWTPSLLTSGQVGWFDAAHPPAITWSGSTAAQWADGSSGGNNLTAVATGPSATFQNGLNALFFNGAHGLRTAANLTFGDFTVIAAFAPIAGGTSYDRVADHAFDTGWWLGRESTFDNWGGGVVQPSPPWIFVSLATSAWHLASTSRSGTTQSVRGDGGAVTNSATVPSTTTTSNKVGIGTSYNDVSTDRYKGSIGEVLIYNTALAGDDLAKVEGYLAWKWGIQANLPAGHAYKSAAPVSATNIANPLGLSVTASVGDETVIGKANVDAATNLATLSMGNESIALAAAANVSGQCAFVFTAGGPALPGQSPLASLTPTGSQTIGAELGAWVAFDTPGYVTAVRYWRHASASAQTRTVNLWAYAAEVLLRSATGPNDAGLTGWVTVPLTPFEVIAGGYVVSVSNLDYFGNDLAPAFPYLSGNVTVYQSRYRVGAIGNFPNTPSTTNNMFVDVVFNPYSAEEVVIAQGGAIVNVTGQVIYTLDPVAVVVAIPVRTGWNPADTTAKITLSNSDRIATAVSGSYNEITQSTEGHASGVWYAEITADVIGGSYIGIGALTTDYSGLSFAGTAGFIYLSNGDVLNQSAATIANIGTFTAGDVISVSIDADTGKVWFRKNAGNWNAGGVGYTYTTGPALYLTALLPTNTAKVTLNTGVLPFSYTVPPSYLDWFEYPPMNVSVTGLQVTASAGDETILLPVAVNVTGQKIMALSVGTGPIQSVYTTQTPALLSTINSELGVRVRFSHPGYIQTVRYYKIAGAPNGSRTVRLWNYSGQFQMASGGGSDDTGISNAWVNVGMVANVQAGVDYIISINNPGIYGYSNAPPWPVVNGNISLVYSYYAPAGQGNFPDSTLGQDIFLDPQFYAVGAEETVNTGASLTAATNLLTTTVGNESVAIPVLVNATTNLISTTTGTVTLPRLVPVTTNVATTSVNSVTVSLPKQVNASTNVITVSDGIVTATTRTDVSTALTGQSVTAYVGLEGAGSARPGDAWDWQSAVPIGLDLTNSDMTVDAPNAISAGYIKSTTAWDTGKHYVEVTITGSALNLRVGPANIPLTGGAVLHSTGFVNAEGDDGTMPALVPGDVVGIAYNAEAGKVWFRINGGNWNNDPTQAPY